MVELLRTPGLSIKHLDDETRERIRRFVHRKHIDEGLSLSDLAKLIGNKSSGYTSWLTRQLGIQPRPFEEARLKGIHQKVRKYERRPFDGTDEDKAYLLGLRHGDLSVSRPFGDAIRVSTSTTHPQMAELFWRLFRKYGHVYQHPRYKEDTKSYEWNLHAILDNSFAFLLPEITEVWGWISATEGRVRSYLAGLVDAEGNIGISRDKKNTSLMLTIFNTDTVLIQCAKSALEILGYNPVGPYLDKAAGTRSPGYNIEMKKDYWKIVLARFDETRSALERLPFMHPERIAKKNLALSFTYREPWDTVKKRVTALRESIIEERDQFVRFAELEFKRTHETKDSSTSKAQTEP